MTPARLEAPGTLPCRPDRLVEYFRHQERHIGSMMVALQRWLGNFLRLVLLALTVAGCGTGRGHLRPVALGLELTPLVQTARTQLGVPYHPGGTSPAMGFDCSGFTQWVYRQHGISLPRQTGDQYRVGDRVRLDQLQQGDLVFFDIDKKAASHVGIYEARGWFIHCSSPGGRVREDQLAEKYWQQHYLGACRPDVQQTLVSKEDGGGAAIPRPTAK